MKQPTSYQIVLAAAMGYDVTGAEIRVQASKGHDFLLCKNPLGEAEFFEISGERTKLQADRIASRMKASDGWMVYYKQGCDPMCIGWDNWKEFYRSIAPERKERVTWGIVERRPRMTEAERMFEDGRMKRADLPKLAKADQILVLLKS